MTEADRIIDELQAELSRLKARVEQLETEYERLRDVILCVEPGMWWLQPTERKCS